LGEHGAPLSGGQQQRIAIARALYHQPEILVFDEATSSLDSSSEQYIQETIRELRNKNKTIIIIAHRLSTVVHADEIMLLENGQITESGTHKELFSLNGKYH
jgi:ATP-binding cassette subfamily B protein